MSCDLLLDDVCVFRMWLGDVWDINFLFPQKRLMTNAKKKQEGVQNDGYIGS